MGVRDDAVFGTLPLEPRLRKLHVVLPIPNFMILSQLRARVLYGMQQRYDDLRMETVETVDVLFA